MSLLAKVHKGPQLRPHLLGLYGPGGVGKSTFGASAPKPIFLGTDDGVGNLDVASFPTPKTWLEVRQAISELAIENHDFQSLVIDTINGLEPLVWAHVCKEAQAKSIEEVGGGFGKGYVIACEEWVEFWASIKRLRSRMNVICLGHAQMKTVDDIFQGERYDRYSLKMNEKAALLFHEAVDHMFFAGYKVDLSKEKGARKAKARGEGVRVIYTEERPAFLAKRRIPLPFEMELSWDVFAAEAAKFNPIAAPTEDEIEKIFADVKDAAVAYLVSVNWLREGQSLRDLLAAKRKQLLARKDGFLETIAEYQKSLTEESSNE